ncbi:G-protein alpha subunit [Pholiota conissans]|uniref:G-protein alpha subunit n=1 Tax=Pholiota conissans TaxID=109636 RepID=A0A9P5ZHZ7_9AGAR|nr:G-protein alpha subunit [Pholiota conissans]
MQASVMSLAPEDNDPLSLQPPLFETLEERTARLMKERREKEISDMIDEEIERARDAERKAPKAIKILLLGKSTTLKNFQLMYDQKSFHAERASWRAVIQLNVVQSIRTILDAMDRAQKSDHSDPPSSQNLKKSPAYLTNDLLEIKKRLTPLLEVERGLIRRITGGGSELMPQSKSNAPFSKPGLKEIAINSTIPWKNAFSRLTRTDHFDSSDGIDWEDREDPWPILNACMQDMVYLWTCPAIKQLLVKQLLVKQKIKADDLNGYFLDSLDRVAGTRYIPADDDILRARLKTLGVSEHRFKITTNGLMRDWKVFDVGGHRSQVTAWAPFFDDMDAIIFLAPISGFDQVLEEDHRINRLEDSFKLWTMIVTSPLLKNTNIILFLNKIDIFRTKLASGIKLKDFVVSYGDRPNDFDNTTSYLKRKFAGIMQEASSSPRVFYCHFTTVTDTKSTKYIISNLKDMLMRQNLIKTNLMP